MEPLPVDDLDDPRLAEYRDVRDGTLRERRGAFVVEGRLGVKRLVEGGRYRTRSVFVTPAALEALRPSLARLRAGVPVYVASRALLERVVGYPMHRGCLASADRGAPGRFEDALAEGRPAPRLWLALEDVTNPDNVGGIFRNALAFGAERVLLSPRCADPLYRKSLRVSMGATLRLPFHPAHAWPGELDALRGAGFAVAALVADRDAPPLASLGFEKDASGVALLLGGEAEGLSPAARARADLCATIPMAPGVDSLNVASAAAVALQRVATSLGIVPG